MKRFEGRVAVVTGAASGIGRETARALAARGCHLALSDIDPVGLAAAASELRAEPLVVSTHVVDVSDRSAMAVFAGEVFEAHGHAHVLVNNAGVACGDTLEDLSWEDFEWLVGVNFWGVVHGIKFFLPLLRREEEGHVVNLSSMFGFVGLPFQGPYCATKAAVRSLSETLYVELAGTGIGVTSVHPGAIRTNIVRNSRMGDESRRDGAVDLFDRRGTEPAVVARRIVDAIDRNRFRLVVTPEAHAVDWLKRLAPTWSQRLVRRFRPDFGDRESESQA